MHAVQCEAPRGHRGYCCAMPRHSSPTTAADRRAAPLLSRESASGRRRTGLSESSTALADVRRDRLSCDAGRLATGCARSNGAFGDRAARVQGWSRGTERAPYASQLRRVRLTVADARRCRRGGRPARLHLAWANRSDRPSLAMIDGTITDELEQAAGPLDFLDEVPE